MRLPSDSRTVRVLQRRWFLSVPVGLTLAALACSSDPGTGGISIPAAGAGGSAAGSSTAGAGGTTSPAGGASGAGQTTAGASGAAGSVAGGGNAGAPGGAGAGGSAGAAGSGTAGGGSTGMDTPPVRPLMIDPATAKNNQFTFTAKQLDPMAGTSTTDTHAGDNEYAVVKTNQKVGNTPVPVRGKLVMTLGGIGGCCGQGGIGGFAVGLGFHHLAIAMQTKISSAPDEYKKVPEAMRTDEQNRQMGDGRMEAWDGKDRVSWLDINVHDSLAYRAALALKYMQTQDPGGDWAYFLNADDTVRWSDVYLVGYSYGSQTLAVVAKYVRIGRGIATSGPSDEGFPNATWIHQTSATPLDRMYGMFGSTNLDVFVPTTQAAGWLGEPLTVNAGAAAGSFGMSHRFILQGQGHGEFCAGDGGDWKALCQYAFGVTQ